jgi:hypothetical protein
MLASFVDEVGGVALMDGRAELAIEQLNAQGKKELSAWALTNLCVAHTVRRDWPAAREACDDAVSTTVDVATRQGMWAGTRLPRAKKATAAAYSNRAAMLMMSGDSAAAQTDLAKARAAAPSAHFVVRNLKLNGKVSTQVQVQSESAPIG